MDNQKKWHVIVIDWCCMCKKSEELVDHLLLHCEIANTLWNTILSRARLAWVMPKRVVDLFACWRGQLGSLFRMLQCGGWFSLEGKEIVRVSKTVSGRW